MTHRPPSPLDALDPVAAWRQSTERELAREPFGFDEAFVRRLLPWMATFAGYFDAQVEGLEHVPAGPVLLVGNHSGGFLTPDTTALYVAWYGQRGFGQPLLGLGFDAAFGIPGFGALMRRLGQLPGSQRNAKDALAKGGAVLVYPGGAREVFRPWGERHEVQLGGHLGFVRLALEAGVPVVPVVAHGGHETTVVLARGEGLARRLRLDRMRLPVFPLLFQLPWGLSTAMLPGIPLPARIRVRVLPALDWSAHGPGAAQDRAVVDACYGEIAQRMQGALDELVASDPRPLLGRARDLLTRALPGGRW